MEEKCIDLAQKGSTYSQKLSTVTSFTALLSIFCARIYTAMAITKYLQKANIVKIYVPQFTL